jgi:hypothetical protein
VPAAVVRAEHKHLPVYGPVFSLHRHPSKSHAIITTQQSTTTNPTTPSSSHIVHETSQPIYQEAELFRWSPHPVRLLQSPPTRDQLIAWKGQMSHHTRHVKSCFYGAVMSWMSKLSSTQINPVVRSQSFLFQTPGATSPEWTVLHTTILRHPNQVNRTIRLSRLLRDTQMASSPIFGSTLRYLLQSIF